jgi:hypothetical protein
MHEPDHHHFHGVIVSPKACLEGHRVAFASKVFDGMMFDVTDTDFAMLKGKWVEDARPEQELLDRRRVRRRRATRHIDTYEGRPRLAGSHLDNENQRGSGQRSIAVRRFRRMEHRVQHQQVSWKKGRALAVQVFVLASRQGRRLVRRRERGGLGEAQAKRQVARVNAPGGASPVPKVARRCGPMLFLECEHTDHHCSDVGWMQPRAGTRSARRWTTSNRCRDPCIIDLDGHRSGVEEGHARGGIRLGRHDRRCALRVRSVAHGGRHRFSSYEASDGGYRADIGSRGA